MLIANINDILERIKELKNLKTDTELSYYLGVQKSTVSSWKSRETIPYEILFSKCKNENINFTWLLTGEGEKVTNLFDKENEIALKVLEALKSNPIIENIVIMLGEMKDDDVLHIFSILEERKKVRDLEDQITEIKKELNKKRQQVEL